MSVYETSSSLTAFSSAFLLQIAIDTLESSSVLESSMKTSLRHMHKKERFVWLQVFNSALLCRHRVPVSLTYSYHMFDKKSNTPTYEFMQSSSLTLEQVMQLNAACSGSILNHTKRHMNN
ncbi:hypothetical protein KIN20_033930 [Parelaphostrongylus tenuis]|uniref:Uncharacterized protein n=1 Tax=Parelaphostrongylus tenuis TaxID=148309 RepID=A0AAD5R9K7_PARTN|nr:hypothetical protein KIN20_033930 [Parelaphostrongylus tenuis]